MKKVKIIIISLITNVFFSYVLLIIISKKMNPKLLRYSSVEAKRFASVVINDSTNEVLNNKELTNNLLIINKNQENEIEFIDFNTENVNILLKKITDNIQTNLMDIEEGNIKDVYVSTSLKGENFKNVKKGVVCEIPFGSISDNSMLANTGPIIPVKLSFVGKVHTSLDNSIKTYGINNVFMELDAIVIVSLRISLPNLTEEIKVKRKIPLVMKIIQGKIPEYYSNNNDSDNNYSLPLKK